MSSRTPLYRQSAERQRELRVTTGDWIGAVQNAIQAVVIAVGAVWAYYKFVRRGTFQRRAVLTVEADLLTLGSSRALRVMPALQNVGGADIPILIPLRVSAVNVRSFDGELDERGRPLWQDITTVRVFGDHKSLDSKETIVDDVLIPLPTDGVNPAAYRVTCRVYDEGQKRFGRERQTLWEASVIVPVERPVEDTSTNVA
jgi:hypothetical protein